MLTSLSFIFLAGLAMAAVCQKLKLPRIIGMLVTGILLGPYVLNLLDPSILLISADLRQMALIIILIKAGLSLNLSDLKKVGRPAVFMSCLPASCEILGFFLFAPRILGITRIEAAVMGAVLGAVSPAVVIPRMVQLMDAGYGAGKSIPQLIMAGASCDDIFVIVLFSTFVSMAQGGQANLMDFADIPISIILGIILGAAAGYMLSLFVLVGAAVDIRYTLDAGAAAVLMILIALAFRSVGVAVCLLKTSLNRKERLFCIIAYLPKATVQAAIGSVPMAMGLPRRSFSFTSAGQPFCCFVFFLNLFAV